MHAVALLSCSAFCKVVYFVGPGNVHLDSVHMGGSYENKKLHWRLHWAYHMIQMVQQDAKIQQQIHTRYNQVYSQ
jgi:hypothetical protein